MPENNPASIIHHWRLVAAGSWLNGRVFPVVQKSTLGRDSSCDILIPGTHLSRRHAEITVTGDALHIRDLDSANGTFVNGQRINTTTVRAGDQVRFDVLNFVVVAPGMPVESVGNSKQNTSKPTRKAWKTKPTSVGNRHPSVQMSAIKKTTNRVSVIAAIVLTAIVSAVVIYILIQL